MSAPNPELTGRAYLTGPRTAPLPARHRPFWEGGATRPLVGLYRQNMLPMSRFVARIGEGIVRPEAIRPQAWLDLYEESYARTGLLWGDLAWSASPLNGFPWVEAIAGCPVEASLATGSAWANPHPLFATGDVEQALPEVLAGLEFDPSNPWLARLLECTEALVRQSAGRYPVAPGIMRGASDLLAALLGQQRFCLALYDHPEAVVALVERSVALWLRVIEAQQACIPPFAGGYVNAGLWAPAPCPVYQEDASVLISEPTFRRFFLEAGRQVWARYPYAILHLHSAGLHILPAILSGPCPPVVEINLDPAGPPVEQLLPALGRVLACTRLEVLGSQAEVARCIEDLPPAGAAYWVLEETLSVDKMRTSC